MNGKFIIPEYELAIYIIIWIYIFDIIRCFCFVTYVLLLTIFAREVRDRVMVNVNVSSIDQ